MAHKPIFDQTLDLYAMLFVKSDGMDHAVILDYLELDDAGLDGLLRTLDDILRESSPLMIQEAGTSLRLVTRPEYAETLARLRSRKVAPLSDAARETLMIVAYFQPCQKKRIDDIRGIDSERSLSKLIDLGLVRRFSDTKRPVRSALYFTTVLFLEKFGLKSLADLPPLKIPEHLHEDTSATDSADE